jgi:hypothetical protein
MTKLPKDGSKNYQPWSRASELSQVVTPVSHHTLWFTAVDAKVDLQTQRANTQIDIQSVPVDLTC